MEIRGAIRALEREGHLVTVVGDQIKFIPSRYQEPSEVLVQFLNANSEATREYILGRSLTKAITFISEVYDHELVQSLEGKLAKQRDLLRAMDLDTLEDIEVWRIGWIDLMNRVQNEGGKDE